jgi:hypothetical protein
MAACFEHFLVVCCFKIGNKPFSASLVNVNALLYLRHLINIKLRPRSLKMY